MNIVTLAECKDRLSIDFDTKDSDITIMANSIEGELFVETGYMLEDGIVPEVSNPLYDMAKEYVLTKLYIEYFKEQSDENELRLRKLVKSIQLLASIPQ